MKKKTFDIILHSLCDIFINQSSSNFSGFRNQYGNYCISFDSLRDKLENELILYE